MNTIKTILFVENDPVALEMYKNRLQREGFHVESAMDGLEALKLLSQHSPDLVVLDVVLPRLSGSDVLNYIRANPRIQHLPVAVFSNAPMTEPDEQISLAGPTRRLLKTDCTFPMLLQTIHDMLAAASVSASTVASSPDMPQPQNPGALFGPPRASSAPDGQTEFLTRALAEIPKIREHCFAYIKSPASPAGLQHLPDLHRRIHYLSDHAGNVGFTRLAMLANAFDTLLSEIIAKPSWVTPSVLQTIAQAVDCLGYLLKTNTSELAQPMPQAKVLAVDDDAVCNHVIVNTLKRAGFDARSVDHPLTALQLLESQPFDLILLDISMPGMSGFELCEKLRALPHGKAIPVIFITGHNNFDNRKQSVLSGGHDFIIKPVSPSELALKATIHLLKGRAQRSPLPAAAESPAASNPTRLSAQGEAVKAPAAATAVSIALGNFAEDSSLPRELPTDAAVNELAQVELQAAASIASTPAQGGQPNLVFPANQFLPSTESSNSNIENATPPAPITPASTAAIPDEQAATFQPVGANLAAEQGGGDLRINLPTEVFSAAGTPATNGLTQAAPGSADAELAAEFGPAVFPEELFQPLPATPLQPSTDLPGDADAANDSPTPQTESDNSAPVSERPWDPRPPVKEPIPAESAGSQLKETEARCNDLEQQLASARRELVEWQAKIADERQVAAHWQAELKDFKDRVDRLTADLDKAKSAQDQHAADRARFESELREQLNAAKAAADQSGARLKDKEAHSSQLQEQLTGAQRERDESRAQFTAAQQAAEKAELEIKGLRERVGQLTAELDQVRAAQAQQSAERTSREAELREQLETAQTASGQSQGLLKDKEARCAQLEEQLAAAQRERNEVQAQFTAVQQAATNRELEIKGLKDRVGQLTADLEQARAAQAQQSAERTSREAELREQLETAKIASGQSQGLLKDKEARCAQLEEQLAGIRRERDEFEGKWTAEQQAAATAQQETRDLRDQIARLTTDLTQAKSIEEQQAADRTRLESEIRSLTEAEEALRVELAAARERRAFQDGEIRDKQKKLLDVLRENILLLEGSLQIEGPATGAFPPQGPSSESGPAGATQS
jgi:CheY-like chemotaxis protein